MSDMGDKTIFEKYTILKRDIHRRVEDELSKRSNGRDRKPLETGLDIEDDCIQRRSPQIGGRLYDEHVREIVLQNESPIVQGCGGIGHAWSARNGDMGDIGGEHHNCIGSRQESDGTVKEVEVQAIFTGFAELENKFDGKAQTALEKIGRGPAA